MTPEQLLEFQQNIRYLIEHGYMTHDGRATDQFKPIIFIGETAYVGREFKRVDKSI